MVSFPDFSYRIDVNEKSDIRLAGRLKLVALLPPESETKAPPCWRASKMTSWLETRRVASF